MLIASGSLNTLKANVKMVIQHCPIYRRALHICECGRLFGTTPSIAEIPNIKSHPKIPYGFFTKPLLSSPDYSSRLAFTLCPRCGFNADYLCQEPPAPQPFQKTFAQALKKRTGADEDAGVEFKCSMCQHVDEQANMVICMKCQPFVHKDAVMCIKCSKLINHDYYHGAENIIPYVDGAEENYRNKLIVLLEQKRDMALQKLDKAMKALRAALEESIDMSRYEKLKRSIINHQQYPRKTDVERLYADSNYLNNRVDEVCDSVMNLAIFGEFVSYDRFDQILDKMLRHTCSENTSATRRQQKDFIIINDNIDRTAYLKSKRQKRRHASRSSDCQSHATDVDKRDSVDCDLEQTIACAATSKFTLTTNTLPLALQTLTVNEENVTAKNEFITPVASDVSPCRRTVNDNWQTISSSYSASVTENTMKSQKSIIAAKSNLNSDSSTTDHSNDNDFDIVIPTPSLSFMLANPSEIVRQRDTFSHTDQLPGDNELHDFFHPLSKSTKEKSPEFVSQSTTVSATTHMLPPLWSAQYTQAVLPFDATNATEVFARHLCEILEQQNMVDAPKATSTATSVVSERNTSTPSSIFSADDFPSLDAKSQRREKRSLVDKLF